MERLPVEKQFAHAMFRQQIQNLDLEAAKSLLEDLHLLYLNQQALVARLAKGELGWEAR
ncbi:MAG: hypothetical protein ACUVSQ_02570 [Pseudanabaenaceae cyanobacterium]